MVRRRKAKDAKQMKQVLDKQKMQSPDTMGGNASTSKLETLTKENNVLYVDFAKKQLIQLDKLNKTVGDTLGDKGQLSKTLKEIQKSAAGAGGSSGQQKPGSITERVMGLSPQTGKINATAGETVKSTFKEKFGSLRGVLDTTGILKKGHNETFIGGLMDKSLERREQKQQYIQDRVDTQGSTFGSKKSFGESFEKSAKIQGDMQKNQETIKGLEDRGFKEGQIKRGGFYKKGVELEGQLAKVDTRFSDSFGGPTKDADPKKAKVVKAADDTDKNSTKKRSADVKPIKVESTDSKIKADPSKPKTVKPIKVESTDSKIKADPSKPKTVKAADVDDPNSTKKRAKIVKPAANDDSFSGTSSGLGAADMTEADIENQKLMQEQTELLRSIAENTGGARKPNDAQKPKEESGGGGGFLDGIMGMLGSGILKAAKFLFNPKNLMKAFTKFLLPAMIIGSLINGIMDGFKAFMETGSIAEALIAGFGGILSFLTFGLIDAETIRSLVDWFSSFVTDFIIQPLKDFFGFLGDSFDKYIAQPIMEAFGFIGNMLTEYIVEPVKKFFAPIADFFKKIKDQVFGFLEDFGIPEIGFTIPIIGKKVSIGPFYPFRPDEGTKRVATNKSLSESSSSKGDTSDFNQNIVTSGKDAKQNKDGSISYDKDKTNVLSMGEKIVDGKTKFTQNFAQFDPKTGKAMLTGDDAGADGEREISKRAFSKIKANAKEGGSADKVADIVKEDDAYQKLSFFDKMKVDVGYAKATDLAKLKSPEEPQTGNKVASASAESDLAKNAKPAASNTNVVAPTTVNNNSSSTYSIKPPVRNPDAGMQNHLAKKYA
jgi:hypothetical protein